MKVDTWATKGTVLWLLWEASLVTIVLKGRNHILCVSVEHRARHHWPSVRRCGFEPRCSHATPGLPLFSIWRPLAVTNSDSQALGAKRGLRAHWSGPTFSSHKSSYWGPEGRDPSSGVNTQPWTSQVKSAGAYLFLKEEACEVHFRVAGSQLCGLS